jgi:large subunit ribosomal protein L18
MSKTSTYNPPFKRRAEGKTNYSKRMAFLKSGMPRAVIRKSTNNLRVQFIQTENGKDTIITSSHTKELGEYHYAGHLGNVPAAYLTGLLGGMRLARQKTKEVIVDLGVQPSILGTRLFAAVKGIQDAGIVVHADALAFPKEDRLMGKHIEAYAQQDYSKMNRNQFSTYAAKKMNPSEFSKTIEQIKKAILEGVKA